MPDPTQHSAPPYEWTWFEDELLPHRGIYGVRRGSEVVCRTNAHKDGYERAKAIADALNTEANNA